MEAKGKTSGLRILHLEDNPLDIELAQCALEAEGIESTVTQVDNQEDFVSALNRGGFDLIISDYALPTFDGLSALALAREKCPEVPFILLSGTVGEELAIETLKSGATDYVLKDRVARLAPSVRRALLEVKARAERKHLEEQLRQSQKMEAIGRLAGGVAHDFNNLLTAILGYSQLLLSRCGQDSAMRLELEEIQKAGKRAATLTNQLLAFTRKQIMQPQLISLNELILQLQNLLMRLIGEDIELVIRLSAEPLNVRADPGQLEQVIMNLVVNARDAMPTGGKLVIETRNVEVHKRSADRQGTLKPGCYAMLTISDTGCGIDEEIRSRIFEPFFTTKDSGKGTGLGLSMVYGIVTQSGGDVEVYSKPRLGTAFKIHLPLITEEVHIQAEAAITVQMPRGEETILLVEDDSAVRALAARLLTNLGYTILEASNGYDALRLSEGHSTKIDLVVSDVVMPQMSGKALTDRLRINRPDIKVLLISGYTGEFILSYGELDSGVAFLSKPFTPTELARTVRAVLDEPQPQEIDAKRDAAKQARPGLLN